MELGTKLWLVGAYYIDIDQNGQLRIVGPGNHLYFGATGLGPKDLRVLDADEDKGGELKLRLRLRPPERFLRDPAMGHIRRVRSCIQIDGQAEPTFAEVNRRDPWVLAPTNVAVDMEALAITYRRSYGEHYYGTRLNFPAGLQLTRDEERHGFTLDTGAVVEVTLHTITDSASRPHPLTGPILEPARLSLEALPERTQRYSRALLERTTAEIEHLVRYDKTSGFDYGTVFPRDWIESADLGELDLLPSARSYMYETSLRHVDDSGAGWHEDVIGEFKYERDQELKLLGQGFSDLVSPSHPLNQPFQSVLGHLDELIVSRQMIDIEPHYLIGLRRLDLDSFSAGSLERLRRVTAFLLRRARTTDLITFNRLALPYRRHKGEEYYSVGNWRDSTQAFQKVHPVIAPYDVNAVLYPEALRVIRDHADQLKADAGEVEELIDKWDEVKQWYAMTNPDGVPGYALALYDVRTENSKTTFEQLRVNHTDEAYDLFYGRPSERDVVSFARRLVSSDYFYTASGPTLVGHHDGYDHSYYHGDVIWTKQTAFVVAGLQRQLDAGRAQGWHATSLDTIKAVLVTVAETSLHAFERLGEIPELHYDDHGRPRLYTDQPAPEGQMNSVQLWSAIGARRILRTYLLNLAQ